MSTRKPLLCFPATSALRGAKTCTCTGELAFFEAFFFPSVAAVAVAATTAASATRERAVSSVRLCIGNLLFHGWHCSVPRTPRAGAYSRELDAMPVLLAAAGACEIGLKG